MRTRSTNGRAIPFLQGLLITPAIGVAIVGLALQFGTPAFAISIVPSCAKSGLPDLNCAISAFVNIARIIFSVTGSFALLMFVIGGFKIMSSAGNDKKVSEGKEYIKNAIIGIMIILSAAYVIEYGYQQLTGSKKCSGGIEYPITSTDDKGNEKTEYGCCQPPSTIIFIDGKQQCISNCKQIKTFTCMDPAGRTNGAEGCIEGFTDCKGAELCCQK
jgi:hypothetical protein